MKCSVCGREFETVYPCPYNQSFGAVCEEYCDKCFQSEPFPCWEKIERLGKEYKDGEFLFIPKKT